MRQLKEAYARVVYRSDPPIPVMGDAIFEGEDGATVVLPTGDVCRNKTLAATLSSICLAYRTGNPATGGQFDLSTTGTFVYAAGKSG